MQIRTARISLVIIGWLFIISESTAKADTFFTYTGNNYTECALSYCSGGPYSLSITFDSTLTGAALDNLNFQNIRSTIKSYSFSDGSGLDLTQRNSSINGFQFNIETDATGNITSWLVGGCGNGPCSTQVQTNWNSPFGFQPGADFSETALSFSGSYGFSPDNPGSWLPAQGTAQDPIDPIGTTCTSFTSGGECNGWNIVTTHCFFWVQGTCWQFGEVPSGSFTDPPAASGFEYRMTGSSLFTQILTLPAGFGPFTISTGGIILGSFNSGQSVTFPGAGVSDFTISDIAPSANLHDPSSFPIQLAFNTATASFIQTPLSAVPEPQSWVVLLVAFCSLGAVSRVRRRVVRV